MRPPRAASALAALLTGVSLFAVAVPSASADTSPQTLPFGQSWTNTGLITADDGWSGVPGVIGYRGDSLSSGAVDPQTVLADGSATPVDVNANRTDPGTFGTGGIAEFEITNPVVAFQGSVTADAPHLVVTLDTTGQAGITVAYDLRDIDAGAQSAGSTQPVALQFRVGTSGSYTNVPAGFVANAAGAGDTLVTPVSATLPAAANNQSVVQVRMITTDAGGSDQFIGVDDITVTGNAPPQATFSVGDATVTEGDAGTATATFQVTRSSGTGTGSVDYATGDGTAVAPGDYTAENGTVSFVAGDTTEDVTIDVVGETVDESDETFTVTLSNSTGGTIADGSGTGTITDDDTAEVPGATRIRDVQGAAHRSPLALGSTVDNVPGVITARRSNGFYFQDPNPDANDATSEGIFVFTSSTPTAALVVGDAVLVDGSVGEFRPGGESGTNLSITQLTSPTVVETGTGTIVPTIIGGAGRIPPTQVIANDTVGGTVEDPATPFDPPQDGIDFYESLEGMLVTVNDPVVVDASGPSVSFGEIAVLVDGGTGATGRTTRGGIEVDADDFNPERIFLDDAIASTPNADVGDTLGDSTGVVDYSFGNFKVQVLTTPTVTDGGLQPESTTAMPANPSQLTVATFNVENLDPGDGAAQFAAVAAIICDNLAAPDLISLEEVQDNNGATNDAVVDATATIAALQSAISSDCGVSYDYRDIDPVDDQDGGQPGGNIRVGFLFRSGASSRGLAFVDRPGGGSTTANTVQSSGGMPRLAFSPGRIQPTDPAFNNSRKPLAGEFTFNGETLFVVGNHFNSKGGDQPLFGRFQPPALSSEAQRRQQAMLVNAFVNDIRAVDPDASIVVLGDLNDFEFSQPLALVAGDDLSNLSGNVPDADRYSFIFEGNSQLLDHILVSAPLSNAAVLDIVHSNIEFAGGVSDHDPQVALLRVGVDPAPVVPEAPTPLLLLALGATVTFGGFQVIRRRPVPAR